jgi:glutaconyl-CoA/methylmalonyl-CoA decarboxylase subunit gamma
MPTFEMTIGDRSYHVEVPDPGGMPLEVVVDGQAFQVKVAGTESWVSPAARSGGVQAPASVARRTPLSQAASPACADGEDILAPMPGTILSVDVQPGQQVESGQIVCVLEAMKMKNPIRACRGGSVIKTAVQAGQNVAYGDLLVTLG